MYIFLLLIMIACRAENSEKDQSYLKQDADNSENSIQKDIIPGAERFEEYHELIKGKRIALLANQTSMVDSIHLLDFLIEKGIDVKKVFSPEHGFRGTIDRGKQFEFEIDSITGVPIIPVYGKNRKPDLSQLEDVDIVVFDIQDVGVRFYTYISTMHLMMEACAETGTSFLVLDRPNPLGDYVDGPVLKNEFSSFVGMHQIPVVHGLTVGELALMIHGEYWLNDSLLCDLHIVKVKNYSHTDKWPIRVKPSPNLPNDISIRLYPSLCFFEATQVSIGRGTYFPFQVIGYPDSTFGDFSFVPEDIPGMQMDPVQEAKVCFGVDLREISLDVRFTLQYLLDFADKFENRSDMITNRNWFNLLAGNAELADQIIKGMSEEDIRNTWNDELNAYKEKRKKYLLYVDFE
jgi:uncharacterized protein YbbC (DUF1343 family)